MGDMLCLCIGRFAAIRISVLHHLIHANNAIPVKIVTIFFRRNEQIDSKMYMERQRVWSSQNSLQENTVEECLFLLNFKTYSKATVIKVFGIKIDQ